MTRPGAAAVTLTLGVACLAAACGGSDHSPPRQDRVAGARPATPTASSAPTPGNVGCGPFPPRHAWGMSVSSDGTQQWRHELPVHGSDSGNESLRPVMIAGSVVLAQDGTVSALGAADGATRWQWHGGESVYGLWTWADQVIVLTDQVSRHAKLTALDATTGDVRWSHAIPGNGLYANIHAEGGALVWARGDGMLQLVDLSDGRIRWSRHAGRSEALAIVGGRVLYAIDGQLRAYDVGTGAVAWTTPDMPPSPTLTMASGLAVVGTAVSGGDSPTGVTAVDPGSGKVEWRYDNGSDVTVAGGTDSGVVIATYVPKREVTLLDARSGKTLWTENTALALDSHPVFTDGLVIEVEGGVSGFPKVRLVARAFDSGDVRWQAAADHAAASSEPLTRFGDLVVLAQFPPHPGDDGSVDAYDIATGQRAWSVPTPSLVQAPALVSTRQIIVQPADPGYGCAL